MKVDTTILIIGILTSICGLSILINPKILESITLFKEKIIKDVAPGTYNTSLKIGTNFTETKSSKLNLLIFRAFGLMFFVIGVLILVLLFIAN